MSRNISVNIMKHGDGKRIYIKIEVEGSSYTVNGDVASIHIGDLVEDSISISRGRECVRLVPFDERSECASHERTAKPCC